MIDKKKQKMMPSFVFDCFNVRSTKKREKRDKRLKTKHYFSGALNIFLLLFFKTLHSIRKEKKQFIFSQET